MPYPRQAGRPGAQLEVIRTFYGMRMHGRSVKEFPLSSGVGDRLPVVFKKATKKGERKSGKGMVVLAPSPG